MPTLLRTIAAAALALPLASSLAGCGVTQRHTVMTGHDADQVWTAMKAAAEDPDYMSSPNVDERWVVRENHVWSDDAASRIEVYRSLERILHKPTSPPRHETREWKFEIVLEQREPAVIMFRTRNAGVPAHAWDEAARYFDEVERFLGPLPGASSKPATAPAPAPATGS